jgi:NAD(P)-dependent dehydrogenase (short-subunit alcohol dehydrogenase family)
MPVVAYAAKAVDHELCWVRSELLDRYIGRRAEPEEVAAAILFLASPAASMITGHTLVVDGGYLAP